MASWVKFSVFGVLLFAIMMIAYFSYLLSPVGGGGSPRTVIIDSGFGLNEIALLLNRDGFIRSPAMFKIYSLVASSAHLLKPGIYSLSEGMSTPEIVHLLVLGPPDAVVLVNEGRSVKDLENDLVSRGIIAAGALVDFPIDKITGAYPFLFGAKNLEGFLFPDTYRVAPRSDAETIVKKLLDNFRDKALPVFSGSKYSDLILASIIEREVPEPKDRRLVSGILRRRISLGMPLQVDATVTYAKCKGSYENCPPLTKSDFKIKSSYNTYYINGMPPAPISNPGLDAISASINPESSPYLYYLSDPATGKTIFARTLPEHNENRARYLHL